MGAFSIIVEHVKNYNIPEDAISSSFISSKYVENRGKLFGASTGIL